MLARYRATLHPEREGKFRYNSDYLQIEDVNLPVLISYVFIECIAIGIAHRDHLIFDKNPSPFDTGNLIKRHNIRAMYAYETVTRKNIFHLLHILECNNPLGRGINGDIIFQPLDIEDIIDIDTLYFMFGFHKNK